MSIRQDSKLLKQIDYQAVEKVTEAACASRKSAVYRELMSGLSLLFSIDVMATLTLFQQPVMRTSAPPQSVRRDAERCD